MFFRADVTGRQNFNRHRRSRTRRRADRTGRNQCDGKPRLLLHVYAALKESVPNRAAARYDLTSGRRKESALHIQINVTEGTAALSRLQITHLCFSSPLRIKLIKRMKGPERRVGSAARGINIAQPGDSLCAALTWLRRSRTFRARQNILMRLTALIFISG